MKLEGEFLYGLPPVSVPGVEPLSGLTAKSGFRDGTINHIRSRDTAVVIAMGCGLERPVFYPR
jgi:hypothetical protein